MSDAVTVPRTGVCPGAPPDLAPLRGFVRQLAEITGSGRRESEILAAARPVLAGLVTHDDWLPDAWATPNPDHYQQYLLHCDSRARFSVVSFVWGPGQATPTHNRRVWGLVGILRGAEQAQRYRRTRDGLVAEGPPEILRPGDVDAVSPRLGDIHRVSNALPDAVSVSIHVYGGDIGAIERATFASDGTAERFVSGYADRPLPNIWRQEPPIN